MAVHLDVALDERQKAELAAIAPASWFTQIVFANAASPQHRRAGSLRATTTSGAVADWIGLCEPF